MVWNQSRLYLNRRINHMNEPGSDVCSKVYLIQLSEGAIEKHFYFCVLPRLLS